MKKYEYKKEQVFQVDDHRVVHHKIIFHTFPVDESLKEKDYDEYIRQIMKEDRVEYAPEPISIITNDCRVFNSNMSIPKRIETITIK